jgi:hypothetical protein
MLHSLACHFRFVGHLSNLSILNVHDEGYSRNTLCPLNVISTFLIVLFDLMVNHIKVHIKFHNICLKAHHYALWWPSWMEGGAVGHNFERDLTRDHRCQVWFNLVQRFKMSSNFNCSYMPMSSLTYNPGFSVKFFFQSIYTDYAN